MLTPIMDALLCKRRMREVLDPRMTRDAIVEFSNSLLSDPKNILQKFTFTMASKWHSYDIRRLHKIVKNWLRQHFLNCKAPFYMKLHSELTSNNVLHYHLWMVSPSRHRLALLTSRWRKTFGFTYPSVMKHKEYESLIKWSEYCNKQNVFKPFEVVVIGTKKRGI